MVHSPAAARGFFLVRDRRIQSVRAVNRRGQLAEHKLVELSASGTAPADQSNAVADDHVLWEWSCPCTSRQQYHFEAVVKGTYVTQRQMMIQHGHVRPAASAVGASRWYTRCPCMQFG